MTDHTHTVTDTEDHSQTYIGTCEECPFCQNFKNQLEQTTFNQEVAVEQIVRTALSKPTRVGELQLLVEAAYREGLAVPTGEFGIESPSSEADDCWRKSNALRALGRVSELTA